jgi:hypothetical protein
MKAAVLWKVFYTYIDLDRKTKETFAIIGIPPSAQNTAFLAIEFAEKRINEVLQTDDCYFNLQGLERIGLGYLDDK